MNIPLYKKASEIEEEIMPVVINFIDKNFPTYTLALVKNYNKENPYTKHWQNAGVDIILLEIGKEVKEDIRKIYIDAKCHAKYEAPNIIYFELQVLDKHTRKEIHPPWTTISDVLEVEHQWIIFASRKRMILIKKLEFQKFKENHPDLVDVNKIDDHVDMDNPNVVKKNLSLHLAVENQYELFKEMNPAVYELDPFNHWKRIDIETQKYMKFIR